jgi:D-arabinonate dehydratase
MKIDKVEALKVDIPLEKNFAGGTYSVDKRTVIITKIFTSDGLVSEVFSGDDRFRSDLIIKVINEIFANDIIGYDPLKIEEIWNKLFYKFIKNIASENRAILKSTYMRALACVDFALWDIKGKVEKKAVIDLLGKKHNKLKVSTIGGYYIKGKGEKDILNEMQMYQQTLLII